MKKQTEQLERARFDLLKKLVKWNLGELLSGAFFIYIWRIMRRRA